MVLKSKASYGAALALMIGLTGCGRLAHEQASVAGAPSSPPGVVAWLDRPVAVPVASVQATAIPYSTSAPACQASQLRASQGPSGVGLGNRLEGLTLTNTGTRACLMAGKPQVTALNGAGQRVTLLPKPGTYFGPLYPADIAAGASGFLYFGTASACGSTAVEQSSSTLYRSVRLELPGGSRLDTVMELSVGSCGLWMDDLGLPAPAVPAATPAPGSLGSLTAALQIPATVGRGQILHYIVTLTNPTSEPVQLSPCPAYTETLGYPMDRSTSYRLNCEQFTVIRPGAMLRYAMLMSIPNAAPPGLTKFSWSIIGPDGPYAGGALTIS